MKILTFFLLLSVCTLSSAQLDAILKDIKNLNMQQVESKSSPVVNIETKSNNGDVISKNKGFAYVDRKTINKNNTCTEFIDDPKATKTTKTTGLQVRSKFATNDIQTEVGDGDKSKIDINGNLADTQVKTIEASTFSLTSNGQILKSVLVDRHNLVVMNNPDWSLGGVDMNVDALHISLQNCSTSRFIPARIERINNDYDSIAITCRDEQVPALRQFEYIKNKRNATMILKSQTFIACGPKSLMPNSEFYKQLTSRFSCHEKQLVDESGVFEKLTFRNKVSGELIKLSSSDGKDMSFPACGNDGLVTFELSNPNNTSRFMLVNQVIDKNSAGQKTSIF